MKNQSTPTPLPDTPTPTTSGDAGTPGGGGGGGHEQATASPRRLAALLPRFVLFPSVHPCPFVHLTRARTRRKQSIISHQYRVVREAANHQ